MALCTHLDQIADIEPQTPTGCTACLAIGGTWSICACALVAASSAVVTTRPIVTPPTISKRCTIR